MLIRALRPLPPLPEGQWRKSDYELVEVEVPDAHVLCEAQDVRVVASFSEYLADGDGDYRYLDSLFPDLIVERCTGTDALGHKRWLRVSGDGEQISYTAGAVIAALAQMLKAQMAPLEYEVIEPAREEVADARTA